MPELPFTSRFGNLDGNTTGSIFVFVEVGLKSTVSLFMSASISEAIFESLASVYLMAAGGSPSLDPKFPCPSTSGYLSEKSCAMRTRLSYTAASPCG